MRTTKADPASTARKIAILYENARSGAMPALAAGLLFAGYFVDHAPRAALLGWLAAYCLLVGIRIAMQFSYAKSANPHQLRWLYLARAWAATTSLAWGAGILVLPEPGALVPHLFAAFWIAGVTSASCYSHSSDIGTSFSFLIPATLVATGSLAMIDNPASTYLAAGIATYFVYSAYLTVTSHSRMLKEFALQNHNQTLLASVQQERDRTDELNRKLEAEVSRRADVEQALREAYERAEKLSTLDSLTDIANRRQFGAVLEREWSRCRRERLPLSLVLCDIDDFKPFNDFYGHLAGDRCLQCVASVLEDHCRRTTDLAARYGGEEFVLLLPGIGENDAVAFAERARKRIDALNLEHKASRLGDTVTASFGVATVIPSADQRPQVLIAAADLALYQAKASGRNCVRSHTDSISSLDQQLIAELEQIVAHG